MEPLQLALDTSASLPTVAILRGNTLLHEWIGPAEQHHSSTLLQGISACLQKSELEAQKLSFLSIGTGPGMFTGLRVGIATAKFFADIHNLPVAPVSSLLALALAAKTQNKEKNIWALSDAKSQRVYALHIKKNTLCPELEPNDNEEQALTPEEAAKLMLQNDYLLGEGAELFAKHWPKYIELAEKPLHTLRAFHIGEAGYTLFQKKKTITATQLQPRYLKTGQAHL